MSEPNSSQKPNNVNPEYSFTAKKKGIKVQHDKETAHHTSKKESKSTFEFTDSQFIATIPQESDDEIYVVDYESIDDVEFSSGFRKNRIDIQTDDRLYKFWTKDSVDSEELMEFISEGAGADSFTIDGLLGENEEIKREYSSKKKGMQMIDDKKDEQIHLQPSGEDEAKFVFTDDRFLAVVPQDMDDRSFSVNYDSIIEIEYTSGTTKNRIDVYTPAETYTIWVTKNVRENGLIKFIYDKIRGDGSNDLAEELNDDEPIKKVTTSQKNGIKIRGNHTKPEKFEAKFIFTDNRFIYYIPRKESSKLSTVDYDSMVDFEHSSGITKNRIDIHKGRKTYTFWTTGDPSKITKFLSRTAGRERFNLVESDDEGGLLKIEGWTKGSSNINADIDASSDSKGKSFGIQGGPFFASKTSSKSTIEGDISGQISDNSYTAEIEKLEIYKQNLTMESGVELDIHLSEIENVFKQENGLVVEVAGTTFRMGNLPSDAKISGAVSHIKEQMTKSVDKAESSSSDKVDESEDTNSEDTDTTKKLRELKDLHDDGILTDKEFESKKEELLSDL